MIILWFFLSSYAFGALPSFQEVRQSYSSSDGRLLDRHGEVLQELRLSNQGRSLDWVPLVDMSPALRSAVVEIEDHRFFEHNGVDYWAVGGAVLQNLQGEKRGASTITMQTLKFLVPDLQKRRTLWEKVRQARLALELEKKWTKDEILEAYLNLVSFRGEYRGIAAASRALFQKDSHGLDQREALLLAALLRAPGTSKEKLSQRLCLLAKSKSEMGSCEELKAFLTLQKIDLVKRANLAPHLARKLLTKNKSTVQSTVDGAIQRFAQKAVEEQMNLLKEQNVRDAAVVILENKTGKIVAYIGGASTSSSPEVDMANSLRQAGSTLKPFLYATAFEKGYITPESWIIDEPFEIAFERGSYHPENYDKSFKGPVLAKDALASSLNIPAVKVVDLVGVEPFYQKLVGLGFRSLEDSDFYGPSLALGTADVALVELTNAYRTIANEGFWTPIHWDESFAQKPVRVFSKESMRMISETLSSRDTRGLTFGWDSVLATSYPAAVKTGTSKDMRDNWCVGYTKNYTVGVWVGNAQGDSMHQVSGVSGAAPIWRTLIDKLPASQFDFTPSKRDKVAHELYENNFSKIKYPLDGSIIALDPDIPDANEWIPLEAQGDGKFLIDGKPAEDRWQPIRGRHRISLVGKSGASLDEIRIEVR